MFDLNASTFVTQKLWNLYKFFCIRFKISFGGMWKYELLSVVRGSKSLKSPDLKDFYCILLLNGMIISNFIVYYYKFHSYKLKPQLDSIIL